MFGSTGRNFMSGPGMFRIDLSMFKTFQITERFRMELRGESFDLTNTPGVRQSEHDVFHQHQRQLRRSYWHSQQRRRRQRHWPV